MALSAGARLGPYEILAPLGAGGMGEVYRARDSKLERNVAIKVLPATLAQDPDRLARFEREAKVLAALNHPNIAQIYGVEERALVMELVAGETLRGPFSLETALNYARQIASALEAAHEKGIVHRDLKPANIMITPAGVVKVLDFGLAAVPQASADDAGDPTHSPTLTIAATQVGMIMGTAAYMSPEQAAGKPVDKRADIWSFGVVFFEMLTGKRLFDGETISHTLAAVLTKEPDLQQVPVRVRRLLQSCLEKDARRRLRDIGDAWRLLEDPPAAAAAATRFSWFPWAAAAVLAGLVVFAWTRAPRASTGTQNDVTLSIVPPAGKQMRDIGQLTVDRISPDGSAVLFQASDRRLYVRRLSSLDAEPLPEFQPSGDAFWSPDSKSIALSTTNGLMKIRLPKGAPEMISTELSAARGGSWSSEGVILAAALDSSPGGLRLYSVPAGGGNAALVEVPPGLKDGRFYSPEFLPGGQDFLFAFARQRSQEAKIYLATLRDGKAVDPTLLLNNDTAAAYTPAGGGRILFVRNDNLYSQKLDRKARKLTGEAELVQESVASAVVFRNSQFSVSDSGIIAWRRGTALVSQLTVFDRQGNHIGVAGVPAPVSSVNLAPNEDHVFTHGEAGSWIVEANGTGRVFFSASTGNGIGALWSADGTRLIVGVGEKILEHSLDGATIRGLGEIPVRQGFLLINDISPDGARLLYGDESKLYVYSLTEKRSTEIVGQDVQNAAMSPDGAWIVYHPFNELGIDVQPLSGKGLRRQIAGSGNFPVWRKDGREILYSDQGKIWSVRVEGSGEQLRFSPPEPLFAAAPTRGTNGGSRPLAVNHDGTRIYYLQSVDEPESGVIYVRTGAIR
jgi:eukaryotic-like serine/threonine-protein kinase